jgi:hypothetical protein
MEQTVLCGYSQELTPGSNFEGHESIVNLLFKANFNIMVTLRLLVQRSLPFSFSAKKKHFSHLPHIFSMCHSSSAFAPLNVCFKNSLTQMNLLQHHDGYIHNVFNKSFSLP